MPDVFRLTPIALIVLGVCLAAVICWVIFHFTRKSSEASPNAETQPPRSAILLYRNGFLADANPAGFDLLSTTDADPELWTTLAQCLSPQFPEFPSTQGSGAEKKIDTFSSLNPKSAAHITLEQWEDFARVRLTQDDTNPGFQDTAARDGTALRAPYPIWISDPSGKITWANERYMALARQHGAESDAIPRLFSQSFEPDVMQRAKLASTDGQEDLWFDVSTQNASSTLIHYASDANAIVRAEIAQRNFVQTLTKTFAQLPIGLAIFDVNRQLTLFNPALIDLTNLPADFLSSRPSMLTFFDRLREMRMIPEPKNYGSWRQQIAELVIAAAGDRYCETWSLPSGVTYKVHGRPHPDGALAILFEDISAEVSLTRRFRSQLDLVQASLDSIDDAVVVFSPVGTATFSNSAYRRFWKTLSETHVAEYSFRDALASWRDRCEASDIWADVENHLTDINPRADYLGVIRTLEGKTKYIRVVYLQGGNKVVIFSDLPEATDTEIEHERPLGQTHPACEEEVAV